MTTFCSVPNLAVIVIKCGSEIIGIANNNEHVLGTNLFLTKDKLEKSRIKSKDENEVLQIWVLASTRAPLTNL